MRGCSPPATTTWMWPGEARRLEHELDALVRREEPEAQHEEAVVEAEGAAGDVAPDGRRLLDPVRDHRRRRDHPPERRLVDDGGRAGAAIAAWTPAMPARATAGAATRCSRGVARSTVDGSTTWCMVVTSGAAPSAPAPSAGDRPISDDGPPYRKSSNWRWTTRADRSRGGADGAGQGPSAHRVGPADLDRPVGERGRVTVELRRHDLDAEPGGRPARGQGWRCTRRPRCGRRGARPAGGYGAISATSGGIGSDHR